MRRQKEGDLPYWLSIALMYGAEPCGKWTDEKEKMGKNMIPHIKQYAASYGWNKKVTDTLFELKHPEDNKRYYQ